jgi:hypothetical protein
MGQTTPSIRSSGTVVQQLRQEDDRVELLVVQVGIVQVGPQDDTDIVAGAAVGTFNDYITSMETGEIVTTLRHIAVQLDAHGPQSR